MVLSARHDVKFAVSGLLELFVAQKDRGKCVEML